MSPKNNDKSVRAMEENDRNTAELLKNQALDGLFDAFELSKALNSALADPESNSAAPSRDLSADLLKASHAIGEAFCRSSQNSTSFAMFNLGLCHLLTARKGKLEDKALKTQWKNKRLKIHTVALAIGELAQELQDLAAHTDDLVLPTYRDATKIRENFDNFITGGNARMRSKEIYGYALFFLLGLARRWGFDLTDNHWLKNQPDLRKVYQDAFLSMNNSSKAPGDIATAVDDALTHAQVQEASKVYFGGLTEAGTSDFRALWKPLFGINKSEHNARLSQHSVERRYVSYRLTSTRSNVGILKSFVVFQSPGLAAGGAGFREYFTVKAFTDYGHEFMRSVGAVVPLGKQIVGFASRRIVGDEDEGFADAMNPLYFRGATMLIFENMWFKNPSSIPYGMLMTTNSGPRNMASPILCLETDAEHSDFAGLGVLDGGSGLAADMCEYTRLTASGSADEDALLKGVWNLLLSKPTKNLVQPEWVQTEDCNGCPPVVFPEMKPDEVSKVFTDCGYSMPAR